jgi:hypothetical protein
LLGDLQNSRSGIAKFHESFWPALKFISLSNKFIEPMERLGDRRLGEFVQLGSFTSLACVKQYKLRLVPPRQSYRVFGSFSRSSRKIRGEEYTMNLAIHFWLLNNTWSYGHYWDWRTTKNPFCHRPKQELL